LDTVVELGGAVVLGGLFTLALNAFTRLRPEAEESEFIILVFGFLALCVGVSLYFSLDSLMACLVFGLGIANFNSQKEKITSLLERYTERLIFLLFFVLSGMTLIPSILLTLWPLILAFVFFRTIGKVGGIFLVTSLLRAPKTQRYYTGIGLLPQGGVVIGLALLVQKEAAFSGFSTTLSGIVMGATLIYELLAPWLAQKSLAAAGELHGKAKS
jgi:Kef-type K+ transport system membrane component KefB